MFLEDLDRLKVRYQITHTYIDAITVMVCTLEEYYEVTFYPNGTIETERFESQAWIEGDAGPDEVLEWWREPKDTQRKKTPKKRKGK
jgi:hypothetical protein